MVVFAKFLKVHKCIFFLLYSNQILYSYLTSDCTTEKNISNFNIINKPPARSFLWFCINVVHKTHKTIRHRKHIIIGRIANKYKAILRSQVAALYYSKNDEQPNR